MAQNMQSKRLVQSQAASLVRCPMVNRILG